MIKGVFRVLVMFYFVVWKQALFTSPFNDSQPHCILYVRSTSIKVLLKKENILCQSRWQHPLSFVASLNLTSLKVELCPQPVG